MSQYTTWYHPYTPSSKFKKKAAYFSMEFAIDQSLKTYSGGLGFLAGSHMRSAFQLKQNMIGIGMLWKYGYYDQGRNEDMTLEAKFIEKSYRFLEDTGIQLTIQIMDNKDVKIKVFVLKPEIFNTIPIYFLSTDVDGNDHLSRTITDKLYDANELTRISQSIVLGIGGAKLVEILGGADIYHLNEGHALPAFYYLADQGKTRDQFVFTTHTPEKAGNEEKSGDFLNRMGFFGRLLSQEELDAECVHDGLLSYTVVAMRHTKRTNAVSKLHAEVSKGMWKDYEGISEIIPITNAQDQEYWQDTELRQAHESGDKASFITRKKTLKKELFRDVANQRGKLFSPDILTIVWARRFAGYKRADLLLRHVDRLDAILENKDFPVQIIWAGKPYPRDFAAIDIFNNLIHFSKTRDNCAVLVGYELELSRKLKCGSDVWLNNPRITREASGTSGMTAAMNGSINVSTLDGWIPEFAKDGVNSFILPALDHTLPMQQQDQLDSENLYELLESRVIPTYYQYPDKWYKILNTAIDDVIPEFTSNRMAREYYENLYR